MKPLTKGLVVALVHVLIVVAVGGKLLYDRRVLPRAWAPTTGVDPALPIRGRYVSLRLVVTADPATMPAGIANGVPVQARLVVADGAIRARFIEAPREGLLGLEGTAVERVKTPAGEAWVLYEPVAFFLPESAPDPTRLGPGQVLWAEVTVLPDGRPRPIRLAVRPAAATTPP